MRGIVRDWRASARFLREHRWPLLEYQLWFSLLVAGLFAGAAGWTADEVTRGTGDHAIANFDIAAFLLTPRGAGLLFLLATIASASVGLQWSGALALTADDGRGALGALRLAALRLPKLIPLALGTAALFVAAAVPFLLIAGLVYGLTLREHDINYYLYNEPPEWRRAVAIGWALAGAYALTTLALFSRTSLAAPKVLRGEAWPLRALRESWRETSGSWPGLTARFGGMIGWAFGGFALGSAGLTWLAREILLELGDDPRPLVAVAGLLFLGIEALAVAAFAWGISGGARLVWLAREASGQPTTVARDPEAAEAMRDNPSRDRLARRVIAGMVAMAVIASLTTTAARLTRREGLENVKVTAHRAGSARAPENTMAALDLAIRDGADYVEIDVQTTRDGEVILLHDADFMRVANHPGRVWDMTLAEIRELDVGRWFGPMHVGERAPTLEEFARAAKGRVRLNVELKYNRRDPDLARATLEILKRAGVLETSLITSLEASAIREVRALEPKARVGLIVTGAVGDPARLDVDALSIRHRLATEALIRRAHLAGKEVHAWSVKNEWTATKLMNRGVDNLITDAPDMAVAARARLRELTALERFALSLKALAGRDARPNRDRDGGAGGDEPFEADDEDEDEGQSPQ